MAKVAVLEAHEDVSSKPSRHVKRSVAALLVRRALARLVSPGLIQMVALQKAAAILTGRESLAYKPIIANGPIPKLLPPRPPDWIFTSYPLPDLREVSVDIR